MPTLHLLCGKIASGKSTLAKTLAAEHGAIVLSEDRLHARNARGDHDFAATDAEFDLITRHFSVPSEEEGLVIEVHRP
ncbi:AAA family ATPase [Pseudomonas sp. L13]|uniref:AAA family ATPase n=1 Tax=Pseudomonas sp. L13 TaxID=343985 RepID=UPI00137AF15E|nr:AAA family ATPase [Pseudomonas sp. L13]NCE91845.1 hypothetical protein [Pseudomonas sp. L13]